MGETLLSSHLPLSILFRNSLSKELYLADTGQLLCAADALKGNGSLEPYDEEGYIAIPPCLWSSDDENDELGVLPRPVLLPLNATLLSIKRANATWAHTGEMASWQMRGVVVPKPKCGQNGRQPPDSRTAPFLRTFTKNTDEREDI